MPDLVSVIVPAYNAAETLTAQLDALSRQTYAGNWEAVVVDNRSTDNTRSLVTMRQQTMPRLRWVAAAERRGVGYARNVGAGATQGDLLAFCDADDVVDPSWLEALVAAAACSDIVGGRFDGTSINPPHVSAWRDDVPHDRLMTSLGFYPFAAGFNFAVWREVVQALRGWKTAYLLGSEDVDFSWRAQISGYQVSFAPNAIVAYRYRSTLRGLARQFRHYGRAEALLYRDFRANGARRAPAKEYVRGWCTLLRSTPRSLANLTSRGRWVRDVMYRMGRLEGAVIHRVVFW